MTYMIFGFIPYAYKQDDRYFIAPHRRLVQTLVFAFYLFGVLITSGAQTNVGSFVPTGNMSEPRDVLSLIALNDGRIFAIGGASIPPFPIPISADLYDPSTGVFTPTAPLIFPARLDFVALRLLNGKVLVVGGANTTFPFSPLPAELYDPVAQTFEVTGSPIAVRDFGGLSGATATLLPDGRVLFVGGQNSQIGVTAELYDPTTGTFSKAGPPHFSHAGNIAVLLHDGRVLIAAGGLNTSFGEPTEATAELYDPVSDTFALSGSMVIPRLFETAALLGNGKVLILEGESFGVGGGPVLTSELYDPQSGTFALSDELHVVREFGTATALGDGNVLVTGGETVQFGHGDGQGAELYDSSLGVFSPVFPMIPHRAHHSAVLMANGNVLIAGGFEINDSIGSAQRSASAQLFIPGAPVPPVPVPTGLSAIAGDGSLYLRWDNPAALVDQYFINIKIGASDQGQIVYVPTLVTSLAGTQQNTSVLITKLPDGTVVQNGVVYQFTIVAKTGGSVSSPSAPIFVIPGGFAGHLPKPPLDPILFVHGWNGSGTLDGTFANTLDFMQHTLRWRFGGQLYHLQDSMVNHVDRGGNCNLANCEDDSTVDSSGNFFTVSFGNPVANYASGQTGLLHWGDEMDGFVTKLQDDNVLTDANQLSLVAHSNGGFAARNFVSFFPNGLFIKQLITYGTPHKGADLFTVPAASGGIITDGGQDAAFTCTGTVVNLSSFLAELSVLPLPSHISYTAISGILLKSVRVGTLVHTTIPAERPADCQSSEWDGLVPKSSAEFSDAPAGTRRFYTSHFHSGEGSDFPTILCALNPACIQIQVFSPVDIEVTAPDGNILSQNVGGIPGASYDVIQNTPDHQTASILIPFPQGGNYTIVPVAKPGALQTDTFTITLTQNSLTNAIASNVMIQDIPSGGYQTRVNAFPVANAGPDQTLECSGHNGTPVVLDGSHSFDPDQDPLNFEWKDENGQLVGSTAAVNILVPLGAHRFTLTVRDGRGGFDSARVIVTIQDTTPPKLDFKLVPSVLWPPDHKLISINSSIGVSDACDAAPIIKLVSITSSEPELSVGSGSTEPDIEGAILGTDDRTFMLRAERSGSGPGRTYTVVYEAGDHSGNKSVGSNVVIVPHNK